VTGPNPTVLARVAPNFVRNSARRIPHLDQRHPVR